VGHATTNECYNERVLQRTVLINKTRMLKEHACYNERGEIISADVAHSCHDVAGLPTLNEVLERITFVLAYRTVLWVSSFYFG
jgi:aspartyl aminopeptidase